MHFPDQIKRHKEKIAYIIIVVVIFLFTLPLLENFLASSKNTDWNQMFSYAYFTRSSILAHQFPLRCPYFGGGYPLIANPQDFSLSPLFLIILLFGEVLGCKLICILAYLLCGVGMFFLTRRVLKFHIAGATFAALSLSLGSWLPYHLFDGNFTKIYYYFVPLLIALIIKSAQNKKYIVYSTFLLATILAQAGLSFVAISLFIFLFLIIYPFRNKTKILKNLILIYILTALLGAVKIFPMLELLQSNPRTIAYENIADHALSLGSLFRSLVEPHHFGYSTIFGGYITMGLALCSFIFAFKENKTLVLLLLICIAIMLGNNSWLNLAKILWNIPVFHSMAKVPKYYSFFIAFLICLAAGFAFNILKRFPANKPLILIALFLITLNTIHIFYANINLHKGLFYIPPTNRIQKKGPFAQAVITNGDLGAQYALLLRNIGTINWYGNINLDENTIPKYFASTTPTPFQINNLRLIENPHYKGEAFWVNPDSKTKPPEILVFTPNYIHIRVDATKAGILVINQNFDTYWKANNNNLFSWNGLLAVKIEKPGKHILKLTYIPVSFWIGLGISFVTLCMCLWKYYNLVNNRSNNQATNKNYYHSD